MLVAYWLLVGRGKGWRLSRALRNPLALPWIVIVGTFFWATLVSATWVPLRIYVYSVFYFLQYVEGLVVLLIVLSAPIDERAKRRLLWVALLGGAWVAFYAVLEIFGLAKSARVIPKGFEIAQEGTGIFSTLGPVYFHAGYFSVVSTLVGFAVFQNSRGPQRLVAGALTLLCTVPAVASGTRAALMALGIAVLVISLRREYRRYFATWLMAVLALAVANFFYAGSLTAERTEGRRRAQSAETRILHPLRQIGEELQSHFPIMPIAGGGFYVVPRRNHWRLGYGIHNLYLRPLEQGGLPSFAASIWLWIRLGKNLGRTRRRPFENAVDERLRIAMFGYFVALLLVGWAGGHFWIQSNTEHLNSYLILLLGLALHESGGGNGGGADDPAGAPALDEGPQPERPPPR